MRTHADAAQIPVPRPGAPLRSRRGRSAPDRSGAGLARKARGPTASATKQQALAAYGKLPLSFTANAGQPDRRVRYSAQGAGFSVFLTRREAMLSLKRSGKRRRARPRASLPRLEPERRHPRRAPGAGQGQLPARERSRQVAHRPAHLRARRLPDLWPGVDMVFAGQNGTLKYEFRLAPGARVPDIRLAYRGAKRLSLDRAGKPAHRHLARRPPRHATAQLPARRRQARARREQLRARAHGGGYGFAVDRRMTAATRSSSTRASLLDLPGRRRLRLRRRHRARRRRQRLPDRVHGLGRLPDDRGRLRHDLQRRQRRLRDEARRERRRPRLLHLPGRKRGRRHTASASRSTAPAAPT